MITELATLQFANLLEIANLSTKDGYKRQQELVAIFRERNQPFMTRMPFRHRYFCEACKIEIGESLYHFEHPGVPYDGEQKQTKWGVPKGVWCAIKTSELHGVLAHGVEPNAQLKQVLESVNY